jgi:hypothetical protein
MQALFWDANGSLGSGAVDRQGRQALHLDGQSARSWQENRRFHCRFFLYFFFFFLFATFFFHQGMVILAGVP